MAKNPMTSRERRGIAALAVVVLLITLAGILHRSCVTATLPPPSTPWPAATADTADTSAAESRSKEKHRKKKKNTGKKKGRGRSKSASPASIPRSRDILGDTIP